MNGLDPVTVFASVVVGIVLATGFIFWLDSKARGL
jgi:hypothetical protein